MPTNVVLPDIDDQKIPNRYQSEIGNYFFIIKHSIPYIYNSVCGIYKDMDIEDHGNYRHM